MEVVGAHAHVAVQLEQLELAEPARLGGDRLFVIDGAWAGLQPDNWPGFRDRFRSLQQSEHQVVVAARETRDPSDCLLEPIDEGAITVKGKEITDPRDLLAAGATMVFDNASRVVNHHDARLLELLAAPAR